MIFSRSKLLVLGAAGALSVLSVVACSDSDSGPHSGTETKPDAADSVDTKDSGGASTDALTDDTDAADDAGCGDACHESSVDATFGGVQRMLTHAHFGAKSSETDGGLHVEIFQGEDLECPTESSPTPERMLIVEGIPEEAAAGQSVTKADGVAAAFFDFTGDQLKEKVFARATSVKVTIVARDAQASPAVLELDVDAVFDDAESDVGTIKGRAYAEHCASLD